MEWVKFLQKLNFFARFHPLQHSQKDPPAGQEGGAEVEEARSAQFY